MTLGGNLSLKKRTFEAVGGYDETFPAAGCEETELAYRASQMGYPLLYQPQAVGYHNHPRSLRQRCQQQAAHMRSMALLISKHPELQTVIHDVDELMPLSAQPLSAGAVVRRGRAAILGLAVVRLTFYRLLMALDGWQAAPRLASFSFWRLMTGWRQTGFREGWKMYGGQTPATALVEGPVTPHGTGDEVVLRTHQSASELTRQGDMDG
jgi:hypothetical protein